MCCALTLISTFLLASAVLADRSCEQCSTKLLTNVTEKGSNFAGAVLQANSTSTFHEVTGTIMLPYIWGSIGCEVGIWLGLDDGTSCGAEFAAGFIGTVTSSGPSYTAATYWYPETLREFGGANFYYGESVQITVSVSDQRTGEVIFENAGDQSSKSIIASLSFESQPSLCQESAWWIVKGMEHSAGLAHFGIVPISQPMVYDQVGFTAGGSRDYDITGDDGLPLTVVRAYGTVIQVIEQCLGT